MLQRFKDNLFNRLAIQPTDRLLVAVSGGIDSMVLLGLLQSLKVNLVIAHCNFKLRGKESEQDEDFVRRQANLYGLSFLCKSFDTKAIARQLGISIQEAARNLRYEWFEQILAKHNCDYYVTGHNFDDRLETFFINALRGSGISGLRSIPEKNGNCIRPLLFATRNEIEDYAGKKKISFREDSSNLKTEYTRNKVRHFLMPALEAVDVDFRKGMAKTLCNMVKTEAFISSEINRRRASYSHNDGRDFKIPIADVVSDENAEFWLFELLKPFGFNAATVSKIFITICSDANPGKIFLSDNFELIIDRRELIVRQKNDKKSPGLFLVPDNITEIDEPLKMLISRTNHDAGFALCKDKRVAQIDFAKLRFPLKIRRYKTGDFFYPIGMRGKKLLSDYLIDLKLSLFEKRDIWLLESDGKIVWVIGYRLDERFKITPGTKQILICRLI